MFFKKLSLFLFIAISAMNIVVAEENNNGNQLNFFTGNFDFSDEKQSAYLIGFQHQDENLNRNTFLGNVSPITGGFITDNSAAYVYTGIEWNVDMSEKIKFIHAFIQLACLGKSWIKEAYVIANPSFDFLHGFEKRELMTLLLYLKNQQFQH